MLDMYSVKRVVILLVVTFNVFVTQAQEPNNLGRMSFKVLHHISRPTSNYYINHALNFEDFKAIGRNDKLVNKEETRKVSFLKK